MFADINQACNHCSENGWCVVMISWRPGKSDVPSITQLLLFKRPAAVIVSQQPDEKHQWRTMGNVLLWYKNIINFILTEYEIKHPLVLEQSVEELTCSNDQYVSKMDEIIVRFERGHPTGSDDSMDSCHLTLLFPFTSAEYFNLFWIIVLVCVHRVKKRW